MTQHTAMLYLSNAATVGIQTELHQPFAEAIRTQAHGFILDTIAGYALKQKLTSIVDGLETFAECGGELRIYQEGLEAMEATIEFWPDDTPDPSFDHLATLCIPRGSVLR
jgi:hypothetical protein